LVSGGGSISNSGLFTAGVAAGGPYTVSATSGSITGTASVTVSPSSTPLYRINCGSNNPISPFNSDQFSSGGTMHFVTNTINTSGVTNGAPMAVYQSERYGNVTYTFPNLSPSTPYKVRLHFAELYQTASGKRTFNVSINDVTVLTNFDIYVAANGNFRALVREFNTTSKSSGQIVIKFTSITNNATISGIEITSVVPNNPPTIVTAATISNSPVVGKSGTLSALASDDGGESNLTYTWTASGTPPAPVTFSAHGTNTAKTTTVSFGKSGTYILQVTATDSSGQSLTSTVTATVAQTLSSTSLSPATTTLAPFETRQFSANTFDQFMNTIVPQPTLTWNVSGGGTISLSGLFSAGANAGGPFTITAKNGSIVGNATVTISPCSLPVAPTNLSAIAGNAQATISWSAVSGATSYNLLRSTTSGSGYTSVSAETTSTNFSNTGLVNGNTYYYVVSATNSCGTGALSTQVSVTPTAATSPCSGLCTPIVIRTGQSQQSGNLGTGAICYETSGVTFAGGICSNMTGRTLSINGTVMSCNGWAIPTKRNNGYCLQVSAGGLNYASYATW
jgi:hypothetical protein